MPRTSTCGVFCLGLGCWPERECCGWWACIQGPWPSGPPARSLAWPPSPGALNTPPATANFSHGPWKATRLLGASDTGVPLDQAAYRDWWLQSDTLQQGDHNAQPATPRGSSKWLLRAALAYGWVWHTVHSFVPTLPAASLPKECCPIAEVTRPAVCSFVTVLVSVLWICWYQRAKLRFVWELVLLCSQMFLTCAWKLSD